MKFSAFFKSFEFVLCPCLLIWPIQLLYESTLMDPRYNLLKKKKKTRHVRRGQGHVSLCETLDKYWTGKLLV